MGTGFDAWYPGYVDYMPMLQNINSFWTETALYRYATPHQYTIADYPRAVSRASLRVALSEPVAARLVAAEGRGRLHADGLDVGARLRHEVQGRTALQPLPVGRDQIRRYEQNPPYAYVIPQQQRDPVAPVELLRRLAFNGVAVSQLTTPPRSTARPIRQAPGSSR